MRHSEKATFVGGDGQSRLDARLDLPSGKPRAYALFAHCFTCGKDVFAASRIAGGLTRHGIAVLRFDFTGLGMSDGEFANTTFSSNIADLVAAADWLRQEHAAPGILIGHSLGGAAVLAAAEAIPEAAAVCTIAAPAEPAHVRRHLRVSAEEIEREGRGEVRLAGRPFTITRQFLDDIEENRLEGRIKGLGKALLVFHGPRDEVVGIENATRIFAAAKHPKSFISLDDADHLLTRREDAIYVADVIAAWTGRYIASVEPEALPELAAPDGAVIVAEAGMGQFAQAISIGGRHSLCADEPLDFGGNDSGPSPYDLLLAGLGACTTMTMRMYASRKGLALERASVTLRHDKIHARDCETCETKEGKIDRIAREITLEGPLDEAARAKLLEIADKCPVHRTLHGEVLVETTLKM
ncbi:MAG TPA: alpha/beta fold hydrolase [Rhodospirillales bacterium]|nr:alpha/beta fold hydrolase [Rhodospirillales bacterium]